MIFNCNFLLHKCIYVDNISVWSSSIPLLKYFERFVFPVLLKSQHPKGIKPIKVLELGSGTGVLGIGIASLGLNVVLTDPALDMNLSEERSSNTMEHLRTNLDKNKELIGDRYKNMRLQCFLKSFYYDFEKIYIV